MIRLNILIESQSCFCCYAQRKIKKSKNGEKRVYSSSISFRFEIEILLLMRKSFTLSNQTIFYANANRNRCSQPRHRHRSNVKIERILLKFLWIMRRTKIVTFLFVLFSSFSYSSCCCFLHQRCCAQSHSVCVTLSGFDWVKQCDSFKILKRPA